MLHHLDGYHSHAHGLGVVLVAQYAGPKWVLVAQYAGPKWVLGQECCCSERVVVAMGVHSCRRKKNMLKNRQDSNTKRSRGIYTLQDGQIVW